MTLKTRLMVYGSVIGKTVIFGMSILFTGMLVGDAGVIEVLALRFLVSMALLLPLRLLGIIKIDLKNKPIKYILLASLFEPILYYIAEALGIANSTTAMSGIILALIPISTLVLECIILKMKPDKVSSFMIAIGTLGVIYILIMSQNSGSDSLIGIIFLLISIILEGLYMVYVKKCTYYFTPDEITYVTALSGAVFFNLCCLGQKVFSKNVYDYFKLFENGSNIIALVFLGIVSTILGMHMNNYATARVKPSVMSAFGGVSTIITILLGVFINHEKIQYYHIIGSVLVIISSVVIGMTAKIEQKNVNDRKQTD